MIGGKRYPVVIQYESNFVVVSMCDFLIQRTALHE
jgi:hypothetical protein